MSTESAAAWLRSFDGQVLAAVRGMPMGDLRHWLTQESTRRGLVTGLGRPLAFVPQESLPQGVAYESWIAETGCVPTRDNPHDRFNALIWLSAPLTKAKLNTLQCRAMKAQACPATRGSLRDAATIWDENLAVMTASGHVDELIHALQEHDWAMLFGQMRSCWGSDWQAWMFGHALLEKLEAPFKSITAHVVVVPVTSATISWQVLDAMLVDRLDERWAPSMFHHLPVLGIPGWHADNADPGFYQDPAVFRPARR